MNTFAILLEERIASTLFLDAESAEQARAIAQHLIDNGNPVTNPDGCDVFGYRICDIAEEPEPNEEQRQNAQANAEALAELERDEAGVQRDTE